MKLQWEQNLESYNCLKLTEPMVSSTSLQQLLLIYLYIKLINQHDLGMQGKNRKHFFSNK